MLIWLISVSEEGTRGRQLSGKSRIWSVVIWGFCCQEQVSQASINNCIPQNTVGCTYLFLPEIAATGDKVLICLIRHLYSSSPSMNGNIFNNTWVDAYFVNSHAKMTLMAIRCLRHSRDPSLYTIVVLSNFILKDIFAISWIYFHKLFELALPMKRRIVAFSFHAAHFKPQIDPYLNPGESKWKTHGCFMGPLSLAHFISDKAWISIISHSFHGDVITHTCHNFNGVLNKPLDTPYIQVEAIIYACIELNLVLVQLTPV